MMDVAKSTQDLYQLVCNSIEVKPAPDYLIPGADGVNLWLKVQHLLEANHREIFAKCKFDRAPEGVDGCHVIVFSGSRLALWCVKGQRCFLAVLPTERGLVEARLHIGNNPDVFELNDADRKDIVLVEIRKAEARDIASLIAASTLTFSANVHTAGMKLLDVMQHAEETPMTTQTTTSTQSPRADIDWVTLSSKVHHSLEADHKEIFAKCEFDTKGTSSHLIFCSGAPAAMLFKKNQRVYFAIHPTLCGKDTVAALLKKPGVQFSMWGGMYVVGVDVGSDLVEQSKIIVKMVSASQSAFQTVAQAIKQVAWNKSAAATKVSALFPHMIFMKPDTLSKVFRPKPTFINPFCSDFLRKSDPKPVSAPAFSDALRTLLFRGASGAGKSAAAMSLLDECITSNKDAAIVGFYKVAENGVTLAELAKEVAKHMSSVVKQCLTTSPSGFGDVICYVVVDEVGSKFDFVSSVVDDCGNTIKEAVVKVLSSKLKYLKKETIYEGISVVVSLAGTGVGRPSSSENSLPDKYYYCDINTDVAKAVFKKALAITTNADLVMEAVDQDPLMRSMCTNCRCAQYAGSELGRLIKLELMNHNEPNVSSLTKRRIHIGSRSICPPNEALLRLKELVRQNAESIVTRASSWYIRANGWGTISDNTTKMELVSALLTIPQTQPHGYHLLSEDTLRTLTCTVGAVVDTLHWQESKSRASNGESLIGAYALENFNAYPIVPSSREVTINDKCVHPHLIGLRLVIPPAVLVVMLSWLAKAPIFGTGTRRSFLF